ncbi:MAG: PTS fructose transporter subunit IIC [Thermoleophilia bacterium]
MKIVAVTACPTGIAHTYMAAEALEEAARAGGHEIKVETQGAAGATPLTAGDIAAADAVIFAVDTGVRERERFAGKPLVEGTTNEAIRDAGSMLDQAVAAAAAAPATAPPQGAAGSGLGDSTPAPVTKVDHEAGIGTRLRQWLMTGVSYMIPFVAAGGILIALAFLFGGAEIAMKVNGGVFNGHHYTAVTDITKIVSQTGWAGLMYKVGTTAFSMLVPILAGFIAYAIADRPGLVPGIVSGLLAVAIGAGFLGGLVGGLIAGFVALGLTRLRVPRAVAGVMPVVFIPLISSLIMGVVMVALIGHPIALAQSGLTNWLAGLSGANSVLLGALLGLMMAFDMGGPVNKVAYTFGLASLASGDTKIMAAVMAAGMTPPIALALATVVRPKLFTLAERRAGEAAWLLGASFITEGAIPFAAADPIRVIPSLMFGSAVTGALSMAFGSTSRAPHGGIWVIALIGRPYYFVVALVVGIVVSAVSVVVAKGIGHRGAAAVDDAGLIDVAATPLAASSGQTLSINS